MDHGIEVSVIIPNYNYGKYIEECVLSVLESDFQHSELEIIIIDDASTDNSIKLINQIKKNTDIPIKLIKNKINSGLAKTRNTGIKNSNGKYLFFLDSDNYINKDCLKKHYEFLINHQDYSACYGPIQKFDNETRELQGILSNEAYNYNQLTSGNYIDAMSMIKKDDLIEVGLYDEQMPCSGWEDYDLWLRMGAHNKKIHFIGGEPLSQYRMHDDSMIHAMPVIDFNSLTKYIKTKFNIKDNEIVSLDEKISPLSQVSVQFFWASADMIFAEEKSYLQTHNLTTDRTEISFDLLKTEKEIQFIRLDIGNTIGLLNIHEIEIKDIQGQVVWTWDKYSIHFKNGLLMIHNNSHWPGKTIQLSLSNDPYFVLAINLILPPLTKLKLHISLSEVGKNQFDYLHSLITTPLSFITEHDISSQHEINEILKTENNQLRLKLLEALRKNGESEQLTDKILKQENVIREYKITEENLLTQIQQFKEFSHKQETLFIQNIESLNVLNKNLVSENENKDTQLIEKDKQFVEIINIRNNLQKELLNYSNSVITLQTENNHQKKQLDDNIKQVASLTNEKDKKEVEITEFTKQITAITQQNGELINQLNETQKKLDSLHSDHFDLNKRSSAIECELFKAEEKNKTLENSYSLVSEELQEYINKYDKKNLLQIIFNKVRSNNK